MGILVATQPFSSIYHEMAPETASLVPPEASTISALPTETLSTEPRQPIFGAPDSLETPDSADTAIDPIDAALTQKAPSPRQNPDDMKQHALETGLVAERHLTEVPDYSKWPASPLDTSQTRAPWPFVLASLILALLLAIQIAYHHRGELVRKMPATQDIFDVFEIEIPLPRETDLISIEASELQPVTEEKSNDPTDHSGHLQLISTLKNQANYPQAWPHLEIALTDSYGAILTCRVFKPGEYLPADIPTAFAPGETPIRLDLNVGELRPTGYRMALLYP
jgi:hypothetical protein